MTETSAELSPAEARWLAGVLPGHRIGRATWLTGGFRNDNLLLDVCPPGAREPDRVVLRRYRQQDRSAVEAALARRLAGVAPVAEVLAVGAVDGLGVLLSRYAPGRLVADLLVDLPADAATALGRQVGTALAAVGTVTLAGPGFLVGPDLVPVPGPPETTDLAAFVDRCLAAGAGAVAGLLAPDELVALRRLAARSAPLVAAVAGDARLVHGDFNPKNLLARQHGGEWMVSAVLDWEFAFSGSPLVDVGNLLRFDDELPAGVVEGFVVGYTAAGGALPPGWRATSRALDLFALADLLTRPAGHPYTDRILVAVRRRLVAGR